eukprot:scaffold199217_cov29-Prasinocladus_malaysianus.AAC.1
MGMHGAKLQLQGTDETDMKLKWMNKLHCLRHTYTSTQKLGDTKRKIAPRKRHAKDSRGSDGQK